MEPVTTSPPEIDAVPAAVRGEPPPRHGGPLALLRFLARHRMLTPKYARLLVRLAWLKLRLGRRLQADGLCFVGQTDQLAPADGKLYSLRDVTATVESIPLICSSIMSKKLAEGVDALVLDVKVGNGAFIQKQVDARRLAQMMVGVGRRMDKRVQALITDMSQPLGYAVGNAVEMMEVSQVLHNEGPAGNSVRVRLVGTKSNRSGYGAKLTATAGGREIPCTLRSGMSYCSQSEAVAHFGIGVGIIRVIGRVVVHGQAADDRSPRQQLRLG